MTQHTDYALHGRFLQGLAAAPRATALHLPTGPVSYEQLHATALRWAGALAVGPDRPPRVVGILAGKTLESYAGLLATLYVGATAVPLHPEFPAARTAGMLTACGVSVLLLDDAGLAVRAEMGDAVAGVPVFAPVVDPRGSGAGLRLPVASATPLAAPAPPAPTTWPTCCSPPARRGGPRGCRSPTATCGTTSRCWTTGTISGPTTGSPSRST